MQLNKIKNIPHKLRRELYRVPAFYSLKEQAHQKTINAHASFLPLLDKQGERSSMFCSVKVPVLFP